MKKIHKDLYYGGTAAIEYLWKKSSQISVKDYYCISKRLVKTGLKVINLLGLEKS